MRDKVDITPWGFFILILSGKRSGKCSGLVSRVGRGAILATGADRPCQSTCTPQAQKDDNKEAVGQHHRIGLSETQQRFLKTQRLREGLVSL